MSIRDDVAQRRLRTMKDRMRQAQARGRIALLRDALGQALGQALAGQPERPECDCAACRLRRAVRERGVGIENADGSIEIDAASIGLNANELADMPADERMRRLLEAVQAVNKPRAH